MGMITFTLVHAHTKKDIQHMHTQEKEKWSKVVYNKTYFTYFRYNPNLP